MVTKEDSPDWLPAGWTVQFNVLKTGRKIKHYVHSQTGKKFFSKDDVLRHVKVHGPEVEQPPTKSRPNKSESEANNQMFVVRNTNEPPEWLPRGWIMVIKTRNSGLKSGATYKIFIDPASGKKFYSKPEVFEYLRNAKRRSSRQKKSSIIQLPSQHPRSEVVIERSTIKDLPGWIKEVKITKNAHRTRKDPFYIDPANGYVFPSRKAVDLYLETGEIGRHVIISKNKHQNEKTLPLPAAKQQEVEHPTARQQPFAGKLTPVEGHSDADSIEHLAPQASSKNDSKMLSTETSLPVAPAATISSHKFSKDDVFDNNDESKEKPTRTMSALAKTEVSTRNQGEKASTDNGPGLTHGTDVKNELNFLVPEVGQSMQENTLRSFSKSSNKKGINSPCQTSDCPASLEPELVTNSLTGVDALRSALISHRSESIQPEVGAENILVFNFEADVKQEKSQKSFSKSSDKKEINLPCQSSDCPSRLEHELVTDSITGVEALQRASMSHRSDPIPPKVGAEIGLVLNFEADMIMKQEQGSTEKGVKKREKRKALDSLSKPNKDNWINLPRRSSKRLAVHKLDLVPNSLSGSASLQDTTVSSKDAANPALGFISDDLASDVSQWREPEQRAERGNTNNALQAEPSQESHKYFHEQSEPKEHSEGLEKNKINGEATEPIIMPPFEEFLSDPCLEFAFKTLTGAIPVESADYNVLGSTHADSMNEKNLLVNNIEDNNNMKTQTKLRKSKNTKEGNVPCHSENRKKSNVPRQPKKGKESNVARQNKNRKESNFPPQPKKRKASNEPSQSKKRKESSIDKESNVPQQSLKRRPGRPRKLMANTNSKTEAVFGSSLAPNSLLGVCQPLEAESGKEYVPQNYEANTFEYLTFGGEQSERTELHPFLSPTEDQLQKAELQFYSVCDYWSDPSLEFASKTPMGSMSVEDNLLIQGYFQQQNNTCQTWRESHSRLQAETSQVPRDSSTSLPDFGFDSLFQTDIFAFFDSLDKQPASQPRLPLNNSPVLPTGNISLPNCSSAASQPPHLEGNKGLGGKMNS